MDDVNFFESQAEKCRAAAAEARDPFDRRGLVQLAGHYDREARRARTAELARNSEDVVPLRRREEAAQAGVGRE